MMTALLHTLDRTIVIGAAPATVFRYFTDDARWAAWWGAGSTVDARPGGRIYIRYSNGVEATGEVLEIDSPQRFVFTMGYASGKPMPPGSSRVTIRLAPHASGTRLDLTHEFEDEAVRNEHVQGWRYMLSLFANVVANDVNANAAATVDAWFTAWTIADADERARAVAAIASPSVQFRDKFGYVDGIDDLVPHMGAALRFMPGITMRRNGEIRHCQGIVLADWTATAADGQAHGSGANVFVLGADGRIVSVTGFWA
jgi:uncharacterized protein YndB with AHSA1/START domain